jgi:rhodanese-related sulfurtransferase
MKNISREELKKKLETGKAKALVNVLTKESYLSGHIPGSVSIPFSSENFEKRVFIQIPGQERRDNSPLRQFRMPGLGDGSEKNREDGL